MVLILLFILTCFRQYLAIALSLPNEQNACLRFCDSQANIPFTTTIVPPSKGPKLGEIEDNIESKAKARGTLFEYKLSPPFIIFNEACSNR